MSRAGRRLARTALLFPGQGSQQVGMGQGLYMTYPSAKQVFDEADAILNEKLTDLIFNGPQERLTLTENAQPAILTHSIAALRSLQECTGESLLQHAAVAMGHSLGEYTALVAAGAITFADALKLVRARAQAMQRSVPLGEGAMAALMPLTELMVNYLVQDLARNGHTIDVANINSGTQIVISGTKAGVSAACELAQAQYGVMRVVALDVSAPFHSRLMAPAARELEPLIRNLDIHTPHLPVIPNITRTPTRDPATIRNALIAQVDGTVNWDASIRAAQQDLSVNSYIEFGNVPILASLARRLRPTPKVTVCGQPSQVEEITARLLAQNDMGEDKLD